MIGCRLYIPKNMKIKVDYKGVAELINFFIRSIFTFGTVQKRVLYTIEQTCWEYNNIFYLELKSSVNNQQKITIVQSFNYLYITYIRLRFYKRSFEKKGKKSFLLTSQEIWKFYIKIFLSKKYILNCNCFCIYFWFDIFF